MDATPVPETLAPEVAARLLEFARACKAAARIVSLYPPSHPAIRSALSRIADAGRQIVVAGPITLTVLPDGLLAGGRAVPKGDSAIGELATLLHRHQIGALTVHEALDADGWHRFLSLLARTPEDMRAAGGVASAWTGGGGGPIDVREIDYAEMLRHEGEAAEGVSWESFLANWLEGSGPMGAGGGSGGGSAGGGAGGSGGGPGFGDGLAAVLDVGGDSAKLVQFAAHVQEQARASGGHDAERKSLVKMMHGLANQVARESPQNLDTTMTQMASAAMQLSPDMLLALITDPPPAAPADPTAPRIDVAAELQSRLTDDLIGRYVADNVVKDRGATGRLATAFQTLVQSPERQHQVLEMARAAAEASPFGQDPQFENVWSSSMNLLTSYSDRQFVSSEYGQELTRARSQPVDVDHLGDIPPAKLRAWHATVNDGAIRGLDQRVVLDLLMLEQRTDEWAGVLDGAVSTVETLAGAGDLAAAMELLDAMVAAAAEQDSPKAPFATAALARLGQGTLTTQVVASLRRASDADAAVAVRICQTLGPVIIPALADAMAAEDNARTSRRLRDILVGFGAATRKHANELRSSRSAAVRRAAVDLLRALGGDDVLPDLRAMLDDADPQVQREALRAIVQIGSNDAFKLLETGLKHGSEHMREAITQALGSLRDERAAPLFVHILNHSGHTGDLEGLYLSCMESLGRLGGGEAAVAVLRRVLNRGEWWAPRRTARMRLTAARALRAMGTLTADRALEEAVMRGPGGARRAARTAMAEPAPTRPGQPRSS